MVVKKLPLEWLVGRLLWALMSILEELPHISKAPITRTCFGEQRNGKVKSIVHLRLFNALIDSSLTLQGSQVRFNNTLTFDGIPSRKYGLRQNLSSRAETSIQ